MKTILVALVAAVALASAFSVAVASGVRARYFENTALAGEPVNERVEASLNLTHFPVTTELFSARFLAQLVAPESAKGPAAHFRIVSTGRVRLWLDEHLLIDGWSPVANKSHEAFMVFPMAKQQSYLLQLDYAHTDQHLPAELALHWNMTDSGSEVVVPGNLFAPDIPDSDGSQERRELHDRLASGWGTYYQADMLSQVSLGKVGLPVVRDLRNEAYLRRAGSTS